MEKVGLLPGDVSGMKYWIIAIAVAAITLLSGACGGNPTDGEVE